MRAVSDPGCVARLDAALWQWSVAQGSVPVSERPLAVAFSGGVDSSALLHRAHAMWPGAVRAIHVNHGLQASAADFEAHCVSVAQHWGVPLRVVRVRVQCGAGDSVEEQARQSRYAALAREAASWGVGRVLLAQHADDQAETVLLALSRGSGVPGLAAMGSSVVHSGLRFDRPWLDVRRRDIADCVRALGLSAIDDPSNADTRFSRNRLRHRVLPVLEAEFPAVVTALGRTARHCAQANELLLALAQEDAAAVGSPPRLAALRALSPARRVNALRAWLVACAGRAPSTAQLDELCKQIAAATTRGHAIHLRIVTGWVERSDDCLVYLPVPPLPLPQVLG